MEVVHEDSIATIVMNEGKGNALSPEVVARLRKALREVQRDDCRAVVLTGSGSIFSAGLNLPLLSGFDRTTLRAFIDDFVDVIAELVALPLPTVAAINGHAIAGGCVLAFCCDYRIMVKDDFRIGLNEIDLGIRFPPAVLDIARKVVPPAAVAEVLMLGRLFGPEEALGAGLLHQTADPQMLLASARTVAHEFAARPTNAMALLKADLYGTLIERMRADRDAAAERFLDGWFSEETRARVREVCEHLAARRR